MTNELRNLDTAAIFRFLQQFAIQIVPIGYLQGQGQRVKSTKQKSSIVSC